MKNLMHFALALLLFCSCRKADLLVTPGKVIPGATQPSSGVQNLGHVFSGTNINWKLHPLNAGNTPLFTYLPGQTSGYNLLMIDYGVMDGLTPINPFRFVAVNMQTKTSKIITIAGSDGNPASYTFGRFVCGIFGMDKKFYVATQGTPAGGGHLIQYDPETQTARDLGKPFTTGASALDISMLNVGSDGALYGGSFGGEGQVKTFRYDYKSFYVDATTLDNTSRFVTSVSGDSRYTYVVCGKNNWFLYAIDRQTGEKRTLKANMGSSITIDIASQSDAPYAHSVATHYRLSGFNMTALKEYERPMTNRISFVPYSETDATVPTVFWNDAERKVIYQFANGVSGSINVDGLQEDVYPTTGPMAYYNNKLYLSCYKQGLLGTYSQAAGFERIGTTTMGIQSMATPPANSADANKIFLGGYPTGRVLQYSATQSWTVNTAGFSNINGGFATETSNPQQSAYFQKADGAGVNGSMSLLGMWYTKSGYIAGAGDNDRITVSSGRELSMGSYKNGQIRNLYLPEFSNYEYQSSCMSADSNYAFVGAVPHDGNSNMGKLYKYNPTSNSILKSWDIQLWGSKYYSICSLQGDILVGICDDIIFLFDFNTGQIIWKESVGQYAGIFGLAVTNDHSVYITHSGLTNYRISKYNFNVSDLSSIKTTKTTLAELEDQDHNERSKPTGLLAVPGADGVSHDLYISGLNSLYRIKV